MNIQVLHGDCREVLRTLGSESVQCVVTSPPYFGLRDYQTAVWRNGDDACDHKPDVKPRTERPRQGLTGGLDYMQAQEPAYRDVCGNCGATRIDNQIGLERTPAEYVETLVEVFREVRRVLRKDGTLWLNLGDSYAGSWGNYSGHNRGNGKQRQITTGSQIHQQAYEGLEDWRPPTASVPGLKPKDLIGIPWRVAFALQADGWWLRSDIIWAKPNCMPESVTDRPTRSHEYIFLLTKSERYFYDADAVREEGQGTWNDGGYRSGHGRYLNGNSFYNSGEVVNDRPAAAKEQVPGRNRRSVWTVPTQPVKESHFATFPERLIEPCILAGTSPRACEHCGAAWERVTTSMPSIAPDGRCACGKKHSSGKIDVAQQRHEIRDQRYCSETTTTGWQPTCTCDNNTGSGKCVVLDPFFGSGTTGRVASRFGRDCIGIDLNAAYLEDIAEKRLNGVQMALEAL